MKSLSPLHYRKLIANIPENGLVRFKVTGNCMQPLIQKGDWVIVDLLPAGHSPKVGDIVLIDREIDFVIHRAIQKSGEYIITKGDWTKTPDPPIKQTQLLGRVATIEKRWCKLNLSHPFVHSLDGFCFRISTLYQKIKKTWRLA